MSSLKTVQVRQVAMGNPGHSEVKMLTRAGVTMGLCFIRMFELSNSQSFEARTCRLHVICPPPFAVRTSQGD